MTDHRERALAVLEPHDISFHGASFRERSEERSRLVKAIAAALKAEADASWNAGRDAAVQRINEIADTWAEMPISDAYREIARSVGALTRPPEEKS